jgi:hypothetical protein
MKTLWFPDYAAAKSYARRHGLYQAPERRSVLMGRTQSAEWSLMTPDTWIEPQALQDDAGTLAAYRAMTKNQLIDRILELEEDEAALSTEVLHMGHKLLKAGLTP